MLVRRCLSALLFVLLCAQPALAQSCSGPSPRLARAVADRSWIPADLVLYGINRFDGVFRLALRSGTVTRIGHHKAAFVEYPTFSSDHRWLSFAFGAGGEGENTTWLYNFASHREHSLGTWRQVAALAPLFAPDGERVVLFRDDGGAANAFIVDLKTFKTRAFSLAASRLEPSGEQVDSYDIGQGAWSTDGRRILFARNSQDRQPIAWSLDAASGALTRVEARAQSMPNGMIGDGAKRIAYVLNGAVLGASCWGCEPDTPRSFDLAGGARVYIATNRYDQDSRIELAVPGQAPRIIAEAPDPIPDAKGEVVVMSGCGPAPAEILGTFEGRFVLYRVSDIYWLYDSIGDRRQAIWRGYTYWRW